MNIKPGDVVYHKLDGRKMLVINVSEPLAICRFIDDEGEYSVSKFNLNELEERAEDV